VSSRVRLAWALSLRRLTAKLRGRPGAPDGAEGAQFLSARGAKQEAPHGPLQRLLGINQATPRSLLMPDPKAILRASPPPCEIL
jgi:hypothetical protein